jgi:hydroxymethylbilane synthase
VLTIGSRGSQLALWQANWIQAQLASRGRECRIRVIRTTGDRISGVPLPQVGAKGMFTKEIEEALLNGSIDLAVHSLKDLPVDLPPGLTLAAIPEREDPRDVLVGRRLDELAPAAKVGTSSLRREAQLRAARPDLAIEPVRGNVDTRLRKLAAGQFDAIVLAAAGLRRLGLAEHIAEVLDPGVMCPAVGQGALAVETRADGGAAWEVCSALDHAGTRAAITAERAVLAALGGGCQVPVGANATVEDGQLSLRAVVISPDGSTLVRQEDRGSVADAARIGKETGARLLAAGARRILESVYGASRTAPGG